MASHRPLGWGEAAPWFFAKAPVNPQFAFSSLGGRFVALTFFGAGGRAEAQAFMRAVAAAGLQLDDSQCVSFGVSTELGDLEDGTVARAFPKQRVFHDPDQAIAASYGLVADGVLRPHWFVLDPTMRVYASGMLEEAERFVATLRGLPPTEHHAGVGGAPWAPVLLLPRVLEPQFCRQLIALYDAGTPEESGFMRTENGRTVGRLDASFKRRADVQIADERLRVHLRDAIRLRVVPEIKKAFQFDVTRIERYIVACYDSTSQGFFKAHRDNTTAGTVHRRFAVTINLNAEDYEGGELALPRIRIAQLSRTDRRRGGVFLLAAARGAAGDQGPPLCHVALPL